MKAKHIILFLVVALACKAEEPAKVEALDFSKSGRIGSIRLDVKETASAKVIFRNTETDYGTYDRDFQRNKTLAVDVTNLSRNPSAVTVDVYWFGQKLVDRKTYVFDHDTAAKELRATDRYHLESQMLTMESSVLNLAALQEKWVSGSKVAGWLVVASDKGVVFAHRASSPSIEQLAKTSLAQLVADYERILRENGGTK